MTDPDNAAEPAVGDAYTMATVRADSIDDAVEAARTIVNVADARPVSFGELARWRARALAAETLAKQLSAVYDEQSAAHVQAARERARLRAVVEAAREVAPSCCSLTRCGCHTCNLVDALDALDEGGA